MPLQSFNQDKELSQFFTNAEYLRGVFKNFVVAHTLPKRILVIHGVGGIGKSSLMRMFRLYCKDVNVPVALASGDEEKSAIDVLAHWKNDLKADGINLVSFDKNLTQYRTIQEKVDEFTKKTQDASSRTSDVVGKVASKTVEAAGGALAGAAIGSIVPGIGTAIGGVLGGVLGSMGGDAFSDWLRGFLTKSEIDLLIDPLKNLTDIFLNDIAKAASKQRIVLILDTFEQMPILEEWTRNFTQQLYPNVLLVIAGRALPNWGRVWPSWMTDAQIEEFKPMSENDMRDLVRRYYATMRGGEPNAEQLQSIIHFAHGLPMVVTGAVQLWIKYGVEDFQSIKPEIVSNLVDRLMEGVPNTLIPALEAAAAVRWFDQPILRAITGSSDVREVLNELRLFPFVRTRSEGFALHNAVREIMDENLRLQDSERHCEIHMRASAYFEKQLKKAASEESLKLGLERLYHHIRADEEMGIMLFVENAEKLVQYKSVGRLRTLMNDVNTYSLLKTNSILWRDYYNARLLQMSTSASDAEEIYLKISENKFAEQKLRAYALCDIAQLRARNSYMSKPSGLENAFTAIRQSLHLVPEMDSKLALNYLHLRYAYMFNGELDKAVEALLELNKFYKKIDDKSGTVYSLDMLKDIYGILGDWQRASNAEKEGLGILPLLPSNPFLETRLVGHNIWYKVWSGQYSEAELGMKQALTLSEKEEQIGDISGLCRDLGFVIGLQNRWDESQEYFSNSVKIHHVRQKHSIGLGSTLGFQGFIFLLQGEFQKAEECLTKSLAFKKELQDNNGIPEILIWLGMMYEMKAGKSQNVERNENLSRAESYFYECLDYRWTSRRYFECSALTYLVRVTYLKGEYENAVGLFTEAERIAHEFRYHDLLASLNLYKGHIQWSGLAKTWSTGFDSAEISYKRAMLHALSFNRFLLDEVVGGEQFPTSLLNIIFQCSMQGIEGQRMVKTLANWWKNPETEFKSDIYGYNFFSEMNSVSLIQVEKLARQREPGSGTAQPRVVETFNRFL